MNPGTPHASLHVTHLGLGADGCARVSGLSAVFPAGLSLIVDEEGDAKTHLLRVLAGEAAADAGTVQWNGTKPSTPAPAPGAQHRFWRDPRAPWPEVSPARWAQDLAARYPRWDAADWQAHAQGLGLAEHLHKELFRLSTGSKRKVLLGDGMCFV